MHKFSVSGFQLELKKRHTFAHEVDDADTSGNPKEQSRRRGMRQEDGEAEASDGQTFAQVGNLFREIDCPNHCYIQLIR